MAAVKKKVPTKKKTPTKKTTVTRAAAKKAAGKPPQQSSSAARQARVFRISFASVYPLYVEKAEKKGRTQAEVDEIIRWLTGYSGKQLQRAIESKVDLETFFAQAPQIHPNAQLIQGVICGMRVEEIADPLMRKIRYLDKLIDELARGKRMASILRSVEGTAR
ncbi:MAG TPA: DUF2200 domain-containing protein [Polyangiaceae bacterium]|nr:DUF2200 domain-containing protein [Polyangiaceae bacterium]